MNRCAADRTEGLSWPVSALQECPGELGTLRREVTVAPCFWDQLCSDAWVSPGVPRTPQVAACSVVPTAKDRRSACEWLWPQRPHADVRGAGEQSSTVSSSLGKLSICFMVSEGIDAYGELPLSSFLSLVCGQVYGYGWCGGWCFFSKTVISLLEKEPYQSSVCQILQN